MISTFQDSSLKFISYTGYIPEQLKEVPPKPMEHETDQQSAKQVDEPMEHETDQQSAKQVDEPSPNHCDLPLTLPGTTCAW